MVRYLKLPLTLFLLLVLLYFPGRSKAEEVIVPDGWITAHINIDLNRKYTRIFTFKDIKDNDRYIVKNGKEYKAWSLDQNMPDDPDYDYMVRLFTIEEELPNFYTFDTPKGEVNLKDLLLKNYLGVIIPYDKILYIINHRKGYSKAEVQEAIWYYTMGSGNYDTDTSSYIDLVNAAEAYGNGYKPSCGEKTIIFAIIRAAEETPSMKPLEDGDPFIIEVPVYDKDCVDP